MIAFDLDDEFEEFMRKVFPMVRETETQYKESRRVFVAGCAAMFFFWVRDVARVSDEEGVEALKKVQDQLDEFMRKRIGFSD